LNALVAADAVLVPIQCEYLALEGVSELLDTLMRIRRTLNPSLEIEGILLTMYDERTTLSRQVATDLRSFFGTQIFQSIIPRNYGSPKPQVSVSLLFSTIRTAKGPRVTHNSLRR